MDGGEVDELARARGARRVPEVDDHRPAVGGERGRLAVGRRQLDRRQSIDGQAAGWSACPAARYSPGRVEHGITASASSLATVRLQITAPTRLMHDRRQQHDARRRAGAATPRGYRSTSDCSWPPGAARRALQRPRRPCSVSVRALRAPQPRHRVTPRSRRSPARRRRARDAGCLGGRPHGRLFLTMRPFWSSSPPHTPHGSSRSRASLRQDGRQRALAADRLGPGDVDDVVGEEQGRERPVAVSAAGETCADGGGTRFRTGAGGVRRWRTCRCPSLSVLIWPRKPERPPGDPGGLRRSLDALGREISRGAGWNGWPQSHGWRWFRTPRGWQLPNPQGSRPSDRARPDRRARRTASLPFAASVGRPVIAGARSFWAVGECVAAAPA